MTDTDVANPSLALPPMEDLAVETVARLIADGYSSSVMKLPRPTLNELARRLAEPGVETSKAIEWLHREKNETVAERNVYRFADRFGEVLKHVIGQHASRMMIAQLTAQPEFQTEDMQRLIKNQVTTLIAQEVTMATSAEDFDTSRLQAILSMITAADKGQLEREKLLLMEAQAEHRAAKAEAEIEKLQMEIDAKKRELQRSIDEAKKAVQTKVDAGDGSKATMDAGEVIALLDKVMKGEA